MPENPRRFVIAIQSSAIVDALVGDPASPELLVVLAGEELQAH